MTIVPVSASGRAGMVMIVRFRGWKRASADRANNDRKQ